MSPAKHEQIWKWSTHDENSANLFFISVKTKAKNLLLQINQYPKNIYKDAFVYCVHSRRGK